MYKIYIHTAPNGKKYVGQTCQELNRRWRNGNGYVRNTYFYRAIEKYGWDSFRHDVVSVCENLQEANNLEAKLIMLLRTNVPEFGYNISAGADGKGTVSESTKRILSEKRKGKFTGEQNPNFGRKHTLEERKKISDHNKGLFVGEKSPRYGTHASEETRKKMSDSRKKSKLAQESIRKLNDSKAKKVLCVETNTIYKSAREAGRITGYGQGNISAACRGEYEQAYGFHWVYV